MDGEFIFRGIIGVIIVVLFILPVIAIISDKEGMNDTDNIPADMPDKRDEASKEEAATDND
ncbi:hypothetical protein [Lysinibacillus sp. BW-2-10]|uniref:hypothetical protein n=1 Tax=Lysinibacillus sp. BW-2-10 TaxID=2590030 RepID=UPI00117CF696|nr:hypothetical protein [Lysinibacillus sp. BW-2-10]TSI11261.1 hypothetical protein FJQ64_01700 [Lysinibacillus sp. BW-2-10]